MNTHDDQEHDSTMNTTSPKAELLAHYATKPVQRFLQVDCFTGCWGDSVLAGNPPHGDALMSGLTHELMSTPDRHLPVRVLIHEDAQREDVRRLLTKMLDHVDSSFERLHEDNERELFERAGITGECPF